ncbi:MAG TPA: aspartate carbamoyltransferase regulatory subunit [Patescibacteria group bacterium]|nr:aspartate carbamoyltransferase regulatory subunit [Patescibacteria group bacterium]
MSLKHISSITAMNRDEFLTWIDEGIGMIPYALTNSRVLDVFHLAPNQLPPALAINMREPSTGTRISFEYAARLLGCPTVVIEGTSSSSAKKGEPIDEMNERLYLQAGCRFFAMRHSVSGVIQSLAENFDQRRLPQTMMDNDVSFFNAGEGKSYHTTQVGMDILTDFCWDHFREAIQTGRNAFIEAIRRFRTIAEEERKQIIAEAINGLAQVFVGDSGHSRIAFDTSWLGTEKMFPGMKFHFVGPPELLIQPRHLQHVVNVTTSERLTPEVPGDKIYMIRCQRERLEQFLSPDRIQNLYASVVSDEAFLKGLEERPDNVVVLDALPFDQTMRTIPRDVQNHARVIYRLQAAMSGAIRAAGLKLGYLNWDKPWDFPKSSEIELQPVEPPKSLEEHQREYDENHTGIPGSVHRLGNGTVLDHIPAMMSRFFDDLLDRNRLRDLHVIPSRNAPSKKYGRKDVMFFPDTFMHLECPELLMTFQLFAPDMTVNIFRGEESIFEKCKVGMPTQLVGTLRCTAGADCVDNHRGEADIVSRFNIFGDKSKPVCRCGYCGNIADIEAMQRRLAKRADD